MDPFPSPSFVPSKCRCGPGGSEYGPTSRTVAAGPIRGRSLTIVLLVPLLQHHRPPHLPRRTGWRGWGCVGGLIVIDAPGNRVELEVVGDELLAVG